MKRSILPIVLCFITLLSCWAADTKPYPLATCIVSGDKIDLAIPPVVYKGQQVRFCCKSCIKKFQANPEKYMVRLQGADRTPPVKPGKP